MQCERYSDFIAICSFMDVFAEIINQNVKDFTYFSAYQLKLVIESERRQQEKRLRTFVHYLLNSIPKFKIPNGRFDDILCDFLIHEGETKIVDFIKQCGGFEILLLRQKLKIIRCLLECQLTRNRSIEEYCRNTDGAHLRPEPLGRDSHGNVYWKFDDHLGNSHSCSFTLIKELQDDDEVPFCEHVRSQQQLRDVIERLEAFKATKYCAGSECDVKKRERGRSKCSSCKKSWHEKCVETNLILNQQEWQCPQCNHKELVEKLREFQTS